MQNTLREKIIEKLILFKAGKLTDEEKFVDRILSLIIESLPEVKKTEGEMNVGEFIKLASREVYRAEVIKMLKGV